MEVGYEPEWEARRWEVKGERWPATVESFKTLILCFDGVSRGDMLLKLK
jgi:hypothetical protein